MPDIAYVNGRFMPLSEAVVSVEDRGFQFGDSIYEVIRGAKGKLFKAKEHLRRLLRSAEAIKLPLPFNLAHLERLINEAYRRSGYEDATIYIQLTRGAAPREHIFPKEPHPTLVITVRRVKELPASLRKIGVPAITTEDIRWARCDIKTTDLLPNILAKQEAVEKGAFEAIFVRDGIVTEGSATTVFTVKNGILRTHPKGNFVLPGITREVLIELAKENGIPVEERAFTLDELYNADEVFIASTTVMVLPVVIVDGKEIGTGKPGDVTMKLYDLLKEEMEREENWS